MHGVEERANYVSGGAGGGKEKGWQSSLLPPAPSTQV